MIPLTKEIRTEKLKGETTKMSKGKLIHKSQLCKLLRISKKQALDKYQPTSKLRLQT